MWSQWGARAGLAVTAMAAVCLAACSTAGAPPAPGALAAAGARATHGTGTAGAPHAMAQHAVARQAGALSPSGSGPVVAIGDSYTAGDLLPLGFGGPPAGCLRSSNGYAVKVADALGAAADFVDAACTSAGVQDMTSPQRTYLGTNPPQLNVLRPDDSLVMLTLGGDDIGVFHVLDKCMELSLTDLDGSPCESYYTRGGTDQLAQRVKNEAAKLTKALDEIRALAPRARVVLVGYPDMFPQRGGCWPVVPITDGDIGYLRGIETQFNAMLSGAAATAGATFVDTYTPTIGHDFCQSSKVKDIEGFVPTSLAAPFHPNTRGQAAMAAAVLATLRAH